MGTCFVNEGEELVGYKIWNDGPSEEREQVEECHGIGYGLTHVVTSLCHIELRYPVSNTIIK